MKERKKRPNVAYDCNALEKKIDQWPRYFWEKISQKRDTIKTGREKGDKIETEHKKGDKKIQK